MEKEKTNQTKVPTLSKVKESKSALEDLQIKAKAIRDEEHKAFEEEYKALVEKYGYRVAGEFLMNVEGAKVYERIIPIR